MSKFENKKFNLLIKLLIALWVENLRLMEFKSDST